MPLIFHEKASEDIRPNHKKKQNPEGRHNHSFASKSQRNLPLQEGKALTNWYRRNEEEIKGILEREIYKDNKVLLPPPTETNIISISNALLNLEKERVSWIRGNMYLLPAQDKLWYLACTSCNKSLDGDEGWSITYSGCNSQTRLQARCHIGVLVNDGTGTIEGTLFTPTAVKLIAFTASQLCEADAKHSPLTAQIKEVLNKKHVVCFVKYFEKDFKGNKVVSYPIVNVYTEAEMTEYARTLQASCSKVVYETA